jgi:hypothetical protein
MTPDDLGATTLEVLVPGALEPLDPALTSAQGAGAAGPPVCPLAYWMGGGGGFGGRGYMSSVPPWWGSCPSQVCGPRCVCVCVCSASVVNAP